MARKRFSHSLRRDHRPVTNPALRDSLRDLEQVLHGPALKPLAWDNDHIAIALEVSVELPPLGNAGGLDIRASEPVLLVLSRTQYPSETPRVYPDRLDFPKDQLAHLYIAGRDRPPAFCLVRGDFSEWYANKRLPDVVIRTQNWLRDAATGELAQNGQQFEPLRLEGYRGSIVYPYGLLADRVQANAANTASNFAIALFENTAPTGAVPTFKLDRMVTLENIDSIVDDFCRGREANEANRLQAKKYCAGYLVWPLDAATTYSDYRVDLPQNWHELQAFGQSFGIDLSFLERHLVLKDPNYLREIPIVCVLRRPQPLIGFAAPLEFVNFYLTLEDADKDKETGCIATNPPVYFQVHNEPLTRQKAQGISGFNAPLPTKTWVAGCGALGSKIVLHFARNGLTNLVLLDPDHLSPHNLVRHALLADSEGMNKALAVEAAIRDMYRHEEVTNLHARGFSAAVMLAPWASAPSFDIQRLFDFTASEAFLHTMLTSPHLDHAAVCRGLLSDHGHLGILSLEGPDRNPRLDDLQALLYAEYERPAVTAWLRREAARAATDSPLVSVGVGCNSETTVLVDDTISTHAAYFAEVLKHSMAAAAPPAHGQVFLSRLSFDGGFPSVSTERLVVEPLTVLPAVNDATWQVRIVPAVLQCIREELVRASPQETGGVFIGRANFKTKTIHVVDLVLAPPDSRANQVCFFRGIQGLPEQVAAVTAATGGQLGYIGEWHTHPQGPECMSQTDAEAVRRFKQEFEALTSPLPVFLLIATPTAFLPFVY